MTDSMWDELREATKQRKLQWEEVEHSTFSTTIDGAKVTLRHVVEEPCIDGVGDRYEYITLNIEGDETPAELTSGVGFLWSSKAMKLYRQVTQDVSERGASALLVRRVSKLL